MLRWLRLILIASVLGAAYLSMTAEKKYLPPSLLDRLNRGVMTSRELDRAFAPSLREVDAFARTGYQGSSPNALVG